MCVCDGEEKKRYREGVRERDKEGGGGIEGEREMVVVVVRGMGDDGRAVDGMRDGRALVRRAKNKRRHRLEL